MLKIIMFIAISFVITGLIALGLIASDRPVAQADVANGAGLDFQSTIERGVSAAVAQRGVPMTDGWSMPVRTYGEANAQIPLIIFIHGSGWVGLQYNSIASALSDQAHVVVPDLRGHGASPERRGDVDYIGQMEDDLAELIEATRLPGQKVVLAGHSSGGGLVVRFAGGKHRALMDQAILLAPFLKHNAPTTRENSGGWARVMTRRIIGLSMLNMFKITALNHLKIIQFDMPEAVLTGENGKLATLAYSFRLNTGFAPRSDYLKDIEALPAFTLIAGKEDEAFFADKYEGMMSAVTNKGSYHIVDGESHLSIVDAKATENLIREVLK